MVSALASSWPSPPELEPPRKKEESLKALKALVSDWDLLGREEEEKEREGGEKGGMDEEKGKKIGGEKREREDMEGKEGRGNGAKDKTGKYVNRER